MSTQYTLLLNHFFPTLTQKSDSKHIVYELTKLSLPALFKQSQMVMGYLLR